MADYFAIANVYTGTLLICLAQIPVAASILWWLEVGRYRWVRLLAR